MNTKSNFTQNEITKFTEELYGNWIFKINHAGNIMFWYSDKQGNPKNAEIYYTMYKKDGKIYFRRSHNGRQNLLFRNYRKGIDLETFNNIGDAIARFNAYGLIYTKYLWSNSRK